MKSNNKQVYIAGGFDPYIAAIFRDKDWRGCKELEHADLVVFTGGEDINPEMYHEEPLKGIYFNTARDEMEKSIFRQARNYGIPMVGICRGAQILNVLCGGRLWQHVDNHGNSHYIKDTITDEITIVTSTHHQQMRPAQTAVVVAKAFDTIKGLSSSICSIKQAHGITVKEPANAGAIVGVAGEDYDAEVVWYPDSRALCFQPHPEIPGAVATNKYFWSVVDRYLSPIISEGMAA